MAIYKVIFNSTDLWEEIGATLTSAPEFPIPAEIKELVKIKGGNGTLTEATGYYNDLELTLNFRSLKKFSPIKDFWQLKRKINLLFNRVTDSRLKFEGYEKYYKVKAAEVGAVVKISEEETDFEINFILDPFLYSETERPETTAGTIIYNGDIPNAPIISFICGSNSEITVQTNGDSLTFTGKQGQTAKINANPYSIVTLNDAPIVSRGNQPILNSGSNKITINGGYNTLKIIKNERYLG